MPRATNNPAAKQRRKRILGQLAGGGKFGDELPDPLRQIESLGPGHVTSR